MARLEGMRLGSCQLLRRIGSGGMGEVYLAEQPALGRLVAVKVIGGATDESTPGSAISPEARQRMTARFVQEARAIATLEHPCILPLYDYGEQDGIHYLVMPYVQGGSLADLLSGKDAPALRLPVSPALALAIITQAAEALQFAHDRGIVHRDVKPGNLLVRMLSTPQTQTLPTVRSSQVLLADFGLARSIVELAAGGGSTGTTGTPLYSAPEQYSGTPVPATDQYALACVVHLLLTGRPVFEGTVAELHHQHLTVVPLPVTQLNPTLPPATSYVLSRALAKRPEDRYPRVADFAAALHSALEPQTALASAWPRLPSVTGSPAPHTDTMPSDPAVPPASPADATATTVPDTPDGGMRRPTAAPLAPAGVAYSGQGPDAPGHIRARRAARTPRLPATSDGAPGMLPLTHRFGGRKRMVVLASVTALRIIALAASMLDLRPSGGSSQGGGFSLGFHLPFGSDATPTPTQALALSSPAASRATATAGNPSGGPPSSTAPGSPQQTATPGLSPSATPSATLSPTSTATLPPPTPTLPPPTPTPIPKGWYQIASQNGPSQQQGFTMAIAIDEYYDPACGGWCQRFRSRVIIYIPDASHNSGTLQFETVLYNASGQQTSTDTHVWLLQDYSYPANHTDMFTAPSLTGYYSTPCVSAWTWFDYNNNTIFNWGTSQIYCAR